MFTICKFLNWFNVSTHTRTQSTNQLLNPNHIFFNRKSNQVFDFLNFKSERQFFSNEKISQRKLNSLSSLPLSLSSSNSSFHSSLNLSVSDSKLTSDSKLENLPFLVNSIFRSRSLTDLVIRKLHKSAESQRIKREMLQKKQLEKEKQAEEDKSIHSGNIEEIHNVPIRVIRRPIPPELDELKVESLMETYKVMFFYYCNRNSKGMHSIKVHKNG